MKRGLWSLLIGCLVLWASSASAETKNKKQNKILQAQVTAVKAAEKAQRHLVAQFFGCVEGKTCPIDAIFSGALRKEMHRRIPAMQKSVKVLQSELVVNIPSAFAEKYKRGWARTLAKLAKAGYDTRQLQKIGLGQSLAQAGDKVAMALAAIRMQRKSGRIKTEYFYFVFWKQNNAWSIAYMEDFPARWMSENKPAGFQPFKAGK